MADDVPTLRGMLVDLGVDIAGLPAAEAPARLRSEDDLDWEVLDWQMVREPVTAIDVTAFGDTHQRLLIPKYQLAKPVPARVIMWVACSEAALRAMASRSYGPFGLVLSERCGDHHVTARLRVVRSRMQVQFDRRITCEIEAEVVGDVELERIAEPLPAERGMRVGEEEA